MRKTIKVLLIILIIVVVLVAAGVIFMSSVSKKLNALTQTQISDIDLSAVADGTYEGEYNAFPISAEVSVTVKNHIITNIDLIKHINGQGGAAEAIPGKVIQAQSLQVDAITGATCSSKVILLAIRDALTRSPSAG
ncbi:MAG TPA: FMN-binding protein [Oscillospiraceae bacterium]|nr:FMN-binding protein [Oscillospiraceae bacterium]HPS35665.1 FMN-binding protein [Oscillospiraceae bacterium]